MHRQIAGSLTGPKTKYLVLVFWLIGMAVLGGFAGKLADVQNNEASSWLPASAESTRGFEKMAPFQSENALPTTIVYVGGQVTGDDLKALADGDIPELAKLDGVDGEIGPATLSGDGAVAQVQVDFDLGADGWNKMPGIVDDIQDIADHEGAKVYVGGQGGQASDAAEAFGGLDSTLLFAALGVVVIILLFVYRSAYLWLLPIFAEMVSLACAMGLVYFLAKYADLTVNGQSQAILSILAIGAGTDYALLLVSRYREELRNFDDRHEAMAHALHRAAPAILASAATVVLAMLCLMVAEMNSTAGMGPVVAIGIAVTYLVNVTLLPALLVIFGRWIFGPRADGHRKWTLASAASIGVGLVLAGIGGIASWLLMDKVGGVTGTVLSVPFILVALAGGLAVITGPLALLQVLLERLTGGHMRPDLGSREPTQSGGWARIGKRIAVRPRAVWIGTTALLAIACLGLFRLDANGMSTEDTYTKEFDSITAQKALVAHDMVDQSNTMLIVANAGKQAEVQQALDGVDGLAEIKHPVSGAVIGKSVSFGPPQGGVVALSSVIDADVSSDKAFETVEAARDAVHAVEGGDALVTGGSAFYLDTKTASQRDGKVIIPLVLAVVLLVLVLLLRALVAPLLLLGTVILSFGAAMGISVLLFEYVFGFAGSDPGFPLFAFVFLVALGIDYNIFLMTRVREEAEIRGTRAASLVALTSTGGVITSAGIVLAATFIVLGTLPLVFLAELGITVALGVMLDTMIVRSILVTALNLDLGDKIWWPSKLAASTTDPDEAPELVNA